MLTGVLDANVVIGLSQGGVFDLLASLYAALYVPPAVIREVIDQGPGLAGEAEPRHALGCGRAAMASLDRARRVGQS
jgi:hypothetical protein